jgi:hypothetical protein
MEAAMEALTGDPHISIPNSLVDELGHIYPRPNMESLENDNFDRNNYIVLFPMTALSIPYNEREVATVERLYFRFAEHIYWMKKNLDANDFRNFNKLANSLGSAFNDLETYYMQAGAIHLMFEWRNDVCWVQISTSYEESPHDLLPFLNAEDLITVNTAKNIIHSALTFLGDPNDTLNNSAEVWLIKSEMVRLYVLDKQNRPEF